MVQQFVLINQAISSYKSMIEQDQQIIKKLMNMLGNGRELKLKSKNGETIRISFQGSSYNDTEPQSSKQHSEEHADHGGDRNQEQAFMTHPQEEYEQEQNHQYFGNIQEDLKEMQDDFTALTKIKESNTENDGDSPQPLEPFHLPNIEQINQINSQSSKKEDSIFKEFAFPQEQPKDDRPKRIHLTSKNVKKDNESVISFFREEHNSLGIEFQNDFAQLHTPLALSSSPVISRIKQESLQLVNYKSQRVKQSMNKLKELHPQSQEIVEIISSRIDELQSIQKSISLINSSISNSLSLGFQSFDVSMLSFHRSLSDPLCHLMANFINKARYESNKNNEKSIPSSFLFMYSQPLVDIKKVEIQEQIDYFEEEQIIQKILKDGKCKVDYIHVPATVQKFHYWIAKGVEIIHFCGHGVQSQENYLLFQNDLGQSENVTVSRLTELLKDRKNSLKLVFVASCHSQSAGKVFIEAGASHVICIRDEYKILDEACHEFVKIFYLTCINTRITICEAFQLSKKQLMLKGKFSKHQCEKFIIIRNHSKNHCSQQFEHRNQTSNFNDLNPRPQFNKYMLSRVEHYIPRSKEIYQIIQLIQNKKRRYISIIGQSGLGKSTLVRELVRYIQFRNLFIDGTVYLQLARCETMAKVFEVLDLEFFQTSQLKLNKTPVENALRLSKLLGDKSILLVFDNCQAIMASEDKESFTKLTQIIMKNCINVVFIFTNRYSISRQIDFCSEVLFQLGKLTVSQSKTLFFKKIPREISKKQYNQFFKLDANENLTQISQHSFFQFLNGHPQAICLTASLLAERTLSQLHRLLLEPNISSQLNKGIQKQLSYRQGINKVVTTAMKISLNVIHHKYKDASEMIKILSLLPNGLQSQMMNRIFPSGKWKDILKRLINHSLVQCIQKASCRYYLVHPQIITQVENEIGMQQKIRYHQRICSQLINRLNKIYKFVGTSSQYSQRAHQLFLIQEDNYRAIFLREMNIIGEKYPLRKFYQNLFKFQFQGLDDQQKNDFGERKISNAEIISMVQVNKKKKSLQLQKNMQKKQPIDLLIVYYLTIVFIIKKVKTSAIEAYLNYGFIISLRRSKYLVIANLLRLKACIYLSQGNDNDAKQFFQMAHAEFAQLGCGLGSACCQAALGYIKLSQSQYAPAKKNLQNALKYYEQIPHPFGKHYLNRWLCSLKSKMNKEQKQLINHKLQAQKLLKQTKQNLRSNNLNNTSYVKHKFGYFAFRFLLDNISLFLQATFQVDLRPKFINQPIVKKHNAIEKNNVILQDIYNQEYGTEQGGEISIKSQIKYQVKPQIKHDFSQFKLGVTSFQNSKQNKDKKESQQSSRNSSKQDNLKISNTLKEKSITSIKYKKKEMAVTSKGK